MKFKEGENVHVIVGNELLSGWYNGKEFGTGNSLVKVSKDKIIATKDCFIAKEKEAELVVVPQFVADWIEQKKANGDHLNIAMDKSWQSMNDKVSGWLEDREDSYDKFARAWLDGYEVEKEPLYYVRFINNCSGYLNVRNDGRRSLSDSVQNDIFKTQFTEAEIKAMDERYWQFAVPVEDSEGEA
ncbi:DUF1642 domain-containing protein [Listeria monocytogenes]|nr:DUF1642 domain-containing protein [Listeria monocytogenes]EAF6044861.1 DUF1642 domain-containing protein [Listeria monocytogenes]EAF9049483.1 DUF1642 domain-containing protein [Listeria monocytogenes]